MKYSDTLVKKTIKAVEDNPIHNFWSIHIHARYDEIESCSIRFETTDGIKMQLLIGGPEVHAQVFTDANQKAPKWLGSCYLKAVNSDGYMMWLGYMLDKMNAFALTVDYFSDEAPAPPLTAEELEAVEELKANGTLYNGSDVEPW